MLPSRNLFFVQGLQVTKCCFYLYTEFQIKYILTTDLLGWKIFKTESHRSEANR